MAEYKISATLMGHEDDVRGVSFPSPKAVLSASRDGSVRLWKLLSDNPPLFDATISSHSRTWMGCVTFLPPNARFPEGLIISSGKDVVIDVRAPSKAAENDAEALLLGHSRDVCALDVDPESNYIVSGSWDHDARIFPVGKWECEVTLTGHGGTVWAVLAYDADTIVTACADEKIRIFRRNGKLVKIFQAGNLPIRALCRLAKGHPSGGDFASADNEGIIRLWTISGTQVGELRGHDSFVYSIASLPSGELVSSGEDRTLRVWKGNECIQTITHPAISVWGVAVCAENGDIVTGASDRIVRVFTRIPERFADAETTAQFEEAVRSSAIPQQTMASTQNENLPGPDFLTQKSGTKDGQIIQIKHPNGSITAHSWSASRGEWDLIGTVVDAVGSSNQKTEYKGQMYDFVFDVDMEDGKPPLKLPYNVSQGPYEAATKFIQDNEAPVGYLEQVANFIITNTQGHTIGGAAPAQGAPDPWGSDNRYRPDDATTARPPPPPVKSLPHKEYIPILLDTAALPKIQKKLVELNKELIASGHKDKSMNPSELRVLAELCTNLGSKDAKVKSKSVEGGLELAVKLATAWPYKDRLPGLDLLRSLAVFPETATYSAPEGGNIIDLFETGAMKEVPSGDNHVMMALRGCVNLFVSPEGRALALQQFEKIQILAVKASTSSSRNVLIAVTTVYVNYAVLFNADKDAAPFDYALAIEEILGKILTKEKDSEVLFRALMALGTVICVDEEVKNAAANVYEVGKAVEAAVKKAPEPRIKNAAREIGELLK
ncbi:hypothetical protein LZ554_008895 [Drepanopeziza brunnea f. sp. 'monogermtubi']|nr:hypothetical protein LZ554_008895 [Drepanopeziza brunnea f. sp. 'monogermtubi']